MFCRRMFFYCILMFLFFIPFVHGDEFLTVNSSSGEIEVNLLRIPHAQGPITEWPAAKGISISKHADDEIKIAGSQKGLWNYGTIPMINPNLDAGGIYRLECWMKIVSISNPIKKPTLKLQTNDNKGEFVKNYNTSGYDTSLLNTWQKLSGKFTISVNEEKGIIRIEKHTKENNSIEMYLKNVSLVKEKGSTADENKKYNFQEVTNEPFVETKNKGYFSVDGTYVYKPDELNEPIFNRGCGLTYPTWKGDGFLFESIKSYTDIAYTRFTWNQLEPIEGVYKFDVIKSWINHWKKKGFKRFGFGVMSTTVGSQATPLWVFESGVPGVPHMQGKQIDPVYWNDLYLIKTRNFIKALGNAFNGLDSIEFVDMRNVGVWGEMHLGFNSSDLWTNEELFHYGYTGENYLNAYKSMIAFYKEFFSETELFLNIAPNNNAIVEFAVKNKINLRYDGLYLTKNNSMSGISTHFVKYGYPGYFNEKVESHTKYYDPPGNQVNDPSGKDSLDDWTAANGIHLSQTEEQGIKILGVQTGKWNYALVKLADEKLKPGRTYRLEGMVKIDSLSNELYMPSLKLQANDSHNKFVENYFTTKYDSAAMNTWQRLWAEFEVGETEKIGSLFVEKGTTKSSSVVMYVKNLSFTDISEIAFEMSSGSSKDDATDPNGVRCYYEFAKFEDNTEDVRNIFKIALSDPVSYINLNYFSLNKGLSVNATEIVEEAAKKIGYRFVLKNISYNSPVKSNSNGTITIELDHEWENLGSAPCYKKYLLEFVLADRNNETVYEFQEEPEIPVWKWFPGVTRVIKSELEIPVEVKEGVYSLKIAMIDPVNSTVVKLPIEGFDGEKYYKLFDLKISRISSNIFIKPILN